MWLFLMCAFRATAVDVSALNGWLPIQAKEHQFTSVHQRNEVGAQINRKIRLPFTFTWEIRLELPDMACQLYIIGKTLQSLPLTFVGHSLTLTVKPPGDAEPIGSCVDIPSHSGIAHVHTGSYRPTSGQSHWTIPSIPLSPNDPACPEGLGECVDNVSRSIWYNHVTTMATDSLFLWLSLSVHLSACARESVCVTATISQLHNIERLSITRYNNIFLHAFYNLFDHSWFIAQISLNVSEYGLPYLQSISYYPE